MLQCLQAGYLHILFQRKQLSSTIWIRKVNPNYLVYHYQKQKKPYFSQMVYSNALEKCLFHFLLLTWVNVILKFCRWDEDGKWGNRHWINSFLNTASHFCTPSYLQIWAWSLFRFHHAAFSHGFLFHPTICQKNFLNLSSIVYQSASIYYYLFLLYLFCVEL